MKHRTECSSVRRLVRSIDKIVEFFPKPVACVGGKAFFISSPNGITDSQFEARSRSVRIVIKD